MRDDRARLLDVREAIERIEKHTTAGREAFDRDELVHHYFGIDFDAAWRVVERDLPELKRNVDALLAALPAAGEPPPAVRKPRRPQPRRISTPHPGRFVFGENSDHPMFFSLRQYSTSTCARIKGGSTTGARTARGTACRPTTCSTESFASCTSFRPGRSGASLADTGLAQSLQSRSIVGSSSRKTTLALADVPLVK